MKKKQTPHLDLYKKFMKSKRMNYEGLCAIFEHVPLLDSKTFELFDPRFGDSVVGSSLYWGNGRDYTLEECHYLRLKCNLRKKFTPLRQTVVLLIAAINNEL